MHTFINFIFELKNKIKKDQIPALANKLTYNLILSIFPFVTFLMTILGFINIKIDKLLEESARALPPQLINILETFLTEVCSSQNLSLLSLSLLASIYSASSGFKAVIEGVNKSYNQKETRGFIKIRLISIGLVFLLAFSIIFSLILLIYGDSIINLISQYYSIGNYLINIFNSLKLIVAAIVLLITVIFIYKFTCPKKVKFKKIIPGSVFTVILWVLASKAYSIYVENFSNYSKVYGSIGSVFILLIWLNIISLCLLIGGEINSML